MSHREKRWKFSDSTLAATAANLDFLFYSRHTRHRIVASMHGRLTRGQRRDGL
jgi:uncharacterized protein (DUF2249 family)